MRYLYAVLATFVVMGCSNQAADDAAVSTAAGRTATAQPPPSREDACSLLTVAEIRRVLPEATRVERNDRLADQGIAACSWHGAGKASFLGLTVWEVSGTDDTPEAHVRTLAMGLADPTRAGAEAAVRVEKVAGVGEEAYAVVEKADDARGILSTGALISLRKNGRIATLSSGFVALEDRAKAMEQLATLGKAVAARL